MKTQSTHHVAPGAAYLLATLGLILLPTPLFSAQFADVTAAAGMTDVNGYCVGAGWGDYNNDGFPDLYITVGADQNRTNAFYLNNGDGTFTRVGAEAGPITTDSRNSKACTWIDFNNDGHVDLFVNNSWMTPNRNNLYWNNGDGTFRNGQAGDLTQRLVCHAMMSACADYDGDGWVDVYLAEGVSPSSPPFTNRLYRATGLGTFIGVDLGPPMSWVNDGVWGDFDNDGDPDLYTCGYTSPNALWRNDGKDGFSKMTNGLPLGGQVIHAAWADYDHDGNLGIALCGTGGTALYRNDGQGTFVQATNLTAAVWGSPAWADYDNDGHPDLLVVGGQDSARPAHLYHNNGDGTFSSVDDVFTASADYWLTCPWADYDNDGFMDVVFTHQYGRNRLYRNLTNSNHWIKVKLTGSASNRDAIGAKVRILATIAGQLVWQMQEVNGGYMQQNDARLHFGLGDATNIDLVRIEWPSGNVQELNQQPAGQILNISEQSYITPVRPSASLGGSVTLTRLAVSEANYQWRFEGVDLDGQTSRVLTLANLSADQAGRYSVVVSTTTATVTNHAYLFIDTQFTKITEGPVVTDNEASWGSVWIDYDQDDDVDLFVVNGFPGGGQRNALYRNDLVEGQRSFTRMTAEAAGDIVAEPGMWLQAAWADYDNDGRPDAWVWGDNVAFYRNVDGVRFERRLDLVPLSWPIGVISLADFDGNGWIDWFLGSAMFVNSTRTNSLYRNLAGQAFEPVTSGPIVQDRLADTEAGMWGDYDGDGDLDLVIALGYEGPGVRLYENLGGGAFRRAQTTGLEDPLGAGALPTEVVWGDYDNDLRLDLFVAVYGSTASVLFHNEGDGVFTRQLMGEAGVQQGHPAWADYDNDGWLDLFLGRGQGSLVHDQLWHNNGDGTFTEVTTGSIVIDPGNSEGGAWGDYDNDGFMDLFVANGYVNGRNKLYRNNGNGNHWLKVNLKGTTSNRSAIGAKVKVQATIASRTFWQLREVPGGNRCQDDLRPNFGLGNATTVRTVRIEWPSGTIQEFANVAADQILVIEEPRRPLLAVVVVGTAGVDGTLRGDPNTAYELHFSGDLATWSPLTTVTTDATGAAAWSDPAPAAAGRFYQARRTAP